MKFQIFISSVQREFAEERKQLFSYLTNDPILSLFFKPFIFENHPASNSKTYDIYLKEVEKSDIKHIGIVINLKEIAQHSQRNYILRFVNN